MDLFKGLLAHGGVVGLVLVGATFVGVAAAIAVFWGILRGEQLVKDDPERLLEVIGPRAAPMTFLRLLERFGTALGLLATISGLSEVFTGVGGDVAALSGGISKALCCTAAGVFVSIVFGCVVTVLDGLTGTLVEASIKTLEARENKATATKNSVPATPALEPTKIGKSQSSQAVVAGVNFGHWLMLAFRNSWNEPQYAKSTSWEGKVVEPLEPYEALAALRMIDDEATLDAIWKDSPWVEYTPVPRLTMPMRKYIWANMKPAAGESAP